MARHVTITGARSIPPQTEADLPGLFGDYLRPFADPDATFYLGGAAGIDTAALDWLASHTQADLTVVVPCTVADQPAAAGEVIRRWQRAGRLTGVVELHADTLGASAYHARNRWMVDRSRFVIAFPHGTDPASGTWYTVNYAAEQDKPRLVVPV
ncbi:DNA-processing protein DprA [Amycolatopsis aidingensis]|uniref:DNA-processing protein DprA n=1 Tax=Amycolatopsis aidingensis TaxID=2842453 RepID=UPI001C0C18A8|nr:DNA-processing protein DprA [Amycolatopsis aidingensis]